MVLQGKCERHRDREMGHRQKKESEETADREGETEAGVGEANVAKVLTGNPGSWAVRGAGVAVPRLLCLLRTSQNKPEKQRPLSLFQDDISANRPRKPGNTSTP